MASITNQLQALTELLKPKNDEADGSDDELNKPARPQFSPGSIGPATKHQHDIYKTEAKKDTKDIWDNQEVPDTAHCEDEYDPRPTPEYDMLFKQAVTSEDMFLQMGNRNPSSASCEEITIKITLPSTEYKEVELDVTDMFLDCRTPKYKLGLHLPYKVDSGNGKAKWDKDKGLLTVTLRLVRELDFLYS